MNKLGVRGKEEGRHSEEALGYIRGFKLPNLCPRNMVATVGLSKQS